MGEQTQNPMLKQMLALDKIPIRVGLTIVDVGPVVGISFVDEDEYVANGYIKVYFALMFGGAVVGHLRDREDFAYLLMQLDDTIFAKNKLVIGDFNTYMDDVEKMCGVYNKKKRTTRKKIVS